jgi:hypothetical protein
MSGLGGQRRRWVTSAFAAAAISAWSLSAGAFEVKTTQSGEPIHWALGQVMFTVDPSVGERVDQGGQAVSDATGAWSGVDGAPVLQTTGGSGSGEIAVDGVNTVIVAPKKFAPIGGALAVTVLSFDSTTGNIVDADIVVSREYDFAVLGANAKPAKGAKAHSNESASGSSSGDGSTPFDLPHVVAHEVGHSLGLGDTQSDTTALMYAYSMPGDPSPRSPSSDDTAGVAQLYPASVTGPAGAIGCGQSNIAGSRPHASDALASMALMAMAGAWLASRRRARALVPVCVVLCFALGDPTPARAIGTSTLASDASAHVVRIDTRIGEDGIYETTLDLAPTACRVRSCPATLRAHAWGGTIGSITQQVGEAPVAGADDEVDVALTGRAVESGAGEAIVLGRHQVSKQQAPTP